MSFTMVTIFPNWFRHALLAGSFGASGCVLTSLQAAEPISAHAESGGRVVFTNETQLYYSSGRVFSQSSKNGSAGPVAVSPGLSRATFQIHELIEGAARQYQVDPELIRAIVQVESNFNPYAVSHRGAMGLMQLIPDTAKRFGVGNAFDPKANLDGGIRYLKYLMELFGGDLRLALAAYNAGENAVIRSRNIPPFAETRNYVGKIAQLYPLDHPSVSPSKMASEIDKFMDPKGVVHFSNTGMP